MTYDIRKAIYQALSTDPQLVELVGDRIHQRTGMEETGHEVEKPFVVYTFGLRFQRGPSKVGAEAQWVHIWAHQGRGDFFTVDRVLDRCREVLEALPNEDTFLEIRHIERSPDLEDTMMETNCRFDRYQAQSVQ